MDLLRGLERRLEAIIDRAGGSRWGGTTHASELAATILREMDLASAEAVVPNRIVVPSAAPAADPEVLPHVSQLIAEEVDERGWRVEGPITVIPAAVRHVSATVEPGPLPPWAFLVGDTDHPITYNRSLIGRHSACDVVLDAPTVSRQHAVLWKADGEVLIRDLGSSNGTTVDGISVGGAPVQVGPAATLAFGRLRLRFRHA